MRIMGLAATAALMAAAGGSAALACEAPGACAYAPTSSAYVFQPSAPMHHHPAPAMRGPAANGPAASAYVFAPGPTPAYAAGDEQGGYDQSYDRSGGEHQGRGYEEREMYQGGDHAGGGGYGYQHGHGGHARSVQVFRFHRESDGSAGQYREGGRYGVHAMQGRGQSYGEVGRVEGYLEPYTPAFGRGVVAERPYTGPGYGYRVEHHGCNTGCDGHGQTAYVRKDVYEEDARPVQVGSDFFFGGINGGAGYGVDGGGFSGGGGFFADSGYGFSATQAFSRSNANAFAGASASARASAMASATAVAFSYGGHPKMMKHGGGCNVCGKPMGKH